MIRIIDLNAAGGFIGFTTRMATVEELESVERAKAIRDAASGGSIGRPLAYARGSGTDLAWLDLDTG